MKLLVLESLFSVCRLGSDEQLPSWALGGTFFSITKTAEELSIVCDESLVPASIKSERGWKIIKVQGPLDFSLTGILSSITNPLAAAKISIFALSTFDTDYILVKAPDLLEATAVLKKNGFLISGV